jgi:hypothetical protein
MPIRHVIFIVLAHLGLLLYFLPNLLELWNGVAQRRVQVLAMVLSGALLGQQVTTGQLLEREAARYNDAWAQFQRGEWTPDIVDYVHPDAKRAREMLTYLRAHSVHWTQLTAAK